MSFFEAIIYGIIQGVSEFLPVSSSGHLALLPQIMKIPDPGVLFDLMMHLGTALAVLLYFKKDILVFVKIFINLILNREKAKSFQEYYYFLNFIIATIASVVCILLIKDTALLIGRSSKLIAFNLIFFGIILYISDRRKNSSEHNPMMESLNLKNSIIIGIMQSFAIFPGVSRSGITITGGRFLGLTRTNASSFSFLMSLPIIFAAIIKNIPVYMQATTNEASMTAMLVGVVSSFIIGIMTIHFFLKLISKIGLLSFSVYRIIIGILVLVLV